MADLRKSGEIEYLRPDAKSQVTVEYDENNVAKRIDTVVISTQHAADASLEQIEKDVKEKVIKAVIPAELLDDETKYFINPTGRFVIGGPQGDSGLTGRKIIVDTYGGYAPMVVVRSLVRTQRKSTVQLRMQLDMLPRILLQQV